ncbi:MAG: hypothetical protein MJZ61_06295 [Bacteroidales bacterium]|nr:hypothetical protein [Bacteroidales bacterium]
MNRLYLIIVVFAMAIVSGGAWGQTRNVVLGSMESDSIEAANLGNRKFHSAIRSYRAGADTSSIYGLSCRRGASLFALQPLAYLSAGYQQKQDNKYYEAMLGLSSTYSCGEKFTIGASLLGGYINPLMSVSHLADSIGRYPQYDGFHKDGKRYLVRYLEFYANYKPSQSIVLQVGKGKKFIGDGFRSVILSASNSGMYYFDTDVDLGSFKYVFSINTAQNWDNNCNSYRQMYMVYHVFSYNPARWLTLGGCETVMMIRRDSLDNTKFMDIHYLNPMLFFRPVEYSLGSPDNALMGVFGKLRFLRNHEIYGQFMLDDFNFREIKENTGTWNNKYAIQMGVKGFVGRLSYLAEYNYIRPYIYSHDKSVNSYSMFGQPLANPHGANLKEMVLNIKYRTDHLGLSLLVDHIEVGRDFDKYSMGNNVLRPYTLHKNRFGNYVGQGDNQKNLNIQLCAEYSPRQLRNFSIVARAGKQQLYKIDNGFFIIGIETRNLFRDHSL